MNSHVFMDHEFQNGNICAISGWAPPNVVVTTMCPQRVTMVDITIYVM